MHGLFKIKSSKPIPKIAQKPLWFWKTLKFEKIPNLGYKVWNAWKWGIRDLLREEKLDESRRNLEEEV